MSTPALLPAAPLGQPDPQLPVELAWYGCDLRSGAIIEDLRGLKPGGALTRKLGETTTLSASLGLAGAPADWEAATAGGRSMLVAVDTATDTPIWPGIVLTRDGGSATDISLQCATPERYLDGRYTGTVTAVQQDQATVLTSLLANAMTDGPPFVLDAPPTGRPLDYAVLDGDDRTILSAVQEIMGMDGGPEWTVDVAWNTDHSGFVLPIRVRPAIGAQAAAPEAVFDFPGCVSSYTLAESYEAGKGATVVQARGEGESAGRLTSQVYTADALIAGGWPRWVHRFTPASGITDPVQLNAHAAKALAMMQTGAKVWSVEAVASVAPRIGRDWGLGDTVRIAVESSPRHPRGAETVARAWAWELDPGADKIRPILVED
ncbi:hypothetical protein ACH4GK_17960 [Streptomyces rimosus]|uniref:hypothetical protein n=1 Tax=Streptomyces rimosus TaxID=1927 RepID=UPI0004C4DA8B|nr:hypothetical protein [Streptomyces rimosus]